MGLSAFVLDRLLPPLARLRRSATGRTNPRTRHVRGGLGYGLRSLELLRPNVARWRRGDALFPAALQVQTVNRCNAACPMCPYPDTVAHEPHAEMDDVLWQKIADECAAESSFVALVPMSMNEPLLDRRLEARIAAFKAVAQPHQQVELVTNGSLLSPARFAALADAGLDLLTVSLHGIRPETYRETMGGLRLDKLERQLDGLRDDDLQRVNVFLRFVRQRGNADEERAVRRRWRRFNVFAYAVNDRSGTLRRFDAVRRPATALTRLRQAVWHRLSRRALPICPHALSLGHVLADGRVPLCANDWHHREILGNVREQTIREMYNGPRAQTLRRLMAEGRYDEIAPCQTCSLWRSSGWAG